MSGPELVVLVAAPLSLVPCVIGSVGYGVSRTCAFVAKSVGAKKTRAVFKRFGKGAKKWMRAPARLLEHYNEHTQPQAP
jgi:hypothetical protein